MTELYTPEQMSFAEKNCGVDLYVLMQNAGAALAQRVKDVCYKNMLKRVLLLCGKGNNGGDGFAAAEMLSLSGIDTTVFLCCGMPKTDLSQAAFESMKNRCVSVTESVPEREFDIVVDCVFGTGFKGSLPEDIAQIFSRYNSIDVYRIACDIPSGVNGATGEADENTFAAHETVTMHRAKTAAALYPACKYFGEITVADIGINSDVTGVFLLDKEDVKNALPKRAPDGHKGTFGKVVCICGSERYTGAAAMAVKAAMRSGAGLVQLCSVKTVIDRLAGNMYGAIFKTLPQNDEGYISSAAADILAQEVKTADSVLFGCGMGCGDDTQILLAAVLENAVCPVIIDADGINCLSANIDILKSTRADVLITPHPMELARLCGIEKPPADRYKAAKELSERFGVSVLAKGAQTFFVTCGGDYIIAKGNTALSKGGSGDMLAGLSAGLSAQGAKLCGALASYILGEAAEKLCQTLSPRGIIAEDILNVLPEVLCDIEK